MYRRGHSAAVAAASLCLAVLTGCGGAANPTEQFKAGYDAARGRLNSAFADADNALTHIRQRSTDQIAASVGVQADRFGTALTALTALKPPPRVATAFVTLTTSLERAEGDLREITVAEKRRDGARALLAIESFAADTHAATDAAVAIKQKLYTS